MSALSSGGACSRPPQTTKKPACRWERATWRNLHCTERPTTLPVLNTSLIKPSPTSLKPQFSHLYNLAMNLDPSETGWHMPVAVAPRRQSQEPRYTVGPGAIRAYVAGLCLIKLQGKRWPQSDVILSTITNSSECLPQLPTPERCLIIVRWLPVWAFPESIPQDTQPHRQALLGQNGGRGYL